ncbi:HIT-like domain-containing protein [Dipodascopsis uninucleata]
MIEARNDLLSEFDFEKVLNQDTRTKLVSLLGKIRNEPAIVIAEKTAFAAQNELQMRELTGKYISDIQELDQNDIYHWFMISTETDLRNAPSAKITLIWPATRVHIDKYSTQMRRLVVETPDLYKSIVLPYVEKMRGNRIQWVYNILSHTVEADRIVYENPDPTEGFILLPDLKWDRTTLSALYLVAIVRRRDIASIRDLNKSHIPWLKKMKQEILTAVYKTYKEMEASKIRLYVHYQPSYYHFHIHVTNIQHDLVEGTAIGKAILYEDLINRLEEMSDLHYGFINSTLTYFLGENSELWVTGFSKLS